MDSASSVDLRGHAAALVGQGRSPHLLYRPEQLDVGLDDVKGLGTVRDEVVKTLNLFLGYATFKDRLGGNPCRGILFEDKPGTGKTHMAKAMARHAGVPTASCGGAQGRAAGAGGADRRRDHGGAGPRRGRPCHPALPRPAPSLLASRPAAR
jgi:AAA+ superfamily predicted ATPase